MSSSWRVNTRRRTSSPRSESHEKNTGGVSTGNSGKQEFELQRAYRARAGRTARCSNSVTTPEPAGWPCPKPPLDARPSSASWTNGRTAAAHLGIPTNRGTRRPGGSTPTAASVPALLFGSGLSIWSETHRLRVGKNGRSSCDLPPLRQKISLFRYIVHSRSQARNQPHHRSRTRCHALRSLDVVCPHVHRSMKACVCVWVRAACPLRLRTALCVWGAPPTRR